MTVTHRWTSRALALLLVAGLLGGCASTRLSHSYRPSPAEVAAVGDDGVAAVRVLAGLVAVERWARSDQEPWGVTVRLRVENPGTRPVSLLTDGLLLVDAGLNEYGAPWGADGLTPVAARGERTYELWFPVPSGADLRDLDLEGFNLRVTLDDGQARRSLAVGFTRYRRPSVPGPPPYWGHVHVGYGPGWYPRYGPGWYSGFGGAWVW